MQKTTVRIGTPQVSLLCLLCPHLTVSFYCHCPVDSSSVPLSHIPVPSKRGCVSRRVVDSPAHAVPGSPTAPMTSNTAPSSDPSAFGSSRLRISDPWHDLVRATLSMPKIPEICLPLLGSTYAVILSDMGCVTGLSLDESYFCPAHENLHWTLTIGIR
ncbi:hypothetical protein F5H01DRAFT_327271 [Linnemannia elongata]|nr:hypothetical protein F5H01DRAFT_327271 [Linnemannia elongata]